MDRLLVAGWDAGCIIKMSRLAACGLRPASGIGTCFRAREKLKKNAKNQSNTNTHISANMGRIDLPDGPADSPRPGGDQERRTSS